jgi:small ligand-binding sensory domain FIST
MSFEIRTDRPERVVRAALDAWRRARKPRGGLLFVSGRLVEALPQVASALAEQLPAAGEDTPVWLLAAGVGVLTERGEVERQSAAAGMVLDGLTATGVPSGPRLEALAEPLADALAAQPAATALVMVRADAFEEDMFQGLAVGPRSHLGTRAFGGGAAPGQDVYVVRPRDVSGGAGAALLVRGPGPARIVTAPGCRLLGPLRPVTQARGSMLLEIAGERALDVLSSSAAGLEDQPLVLLAIAGSPERGELNEPPGGAPPVLLRAIQGVDPSRGGVLAGEPLSVGTQVAFAVRDAAAARTRLDTELRHLARASAGSAPRFGIYVNCAGRGAALHGAADVDTKLVRGRFRDLPLVGLQTAFELSPFGGRLSVQLYSGVFALFCAPS